MKNSIEIQKLDNGKLRIKFVGNEEAKQEILESLEVNGSDSTFWELTESYWANGWGVWSDADSIGWMSSCQVISESYSMDDERMPTGKIWYYAFYQITCPIEEMLEKGYVDFSLA